MVSYTVQLERSVLKALKKLPEFAVKAIAQEIDGLKHSPRPQGCKKLKGSENIYRIRTGNYRIVYRIHDRALLVLVVRVGDRKEVYRDL